MFSNGAEIAPIASPRLLEVMRSTDVASLPRALDVIVPMLAAAEVRQATDGATNPRFGAVSEEAPNQGQRNGRVRSCLVVTDQPDRGAAVAAALAARAAECSIVGPRAVAGRTSFAAAADQLRSAFASGPVDAVVLAFASGDTGAPDNPVCDWKEVLHQHTDAVDAIHSDAAWFRAVADYAEQGERSVRVVALMDATSPIGRTRAQATAQLTRSAKTGTSGRVDAFAVSVESNDRSVEAQVAELAAHLVFVGHQTGLSGAELVAGSGWLGLRSHPAPTGSIWFGGPEIPSWLDPTLRKMVSP
jgi:hypothetical protein